MRVRGVCGGFFSVFKTTVSLHIMVQDWDGGSVRARFSEGLCSSDGLVVSSASISEGFWLSDGLVVSKPMGDC